MLSARGEEDGGERRESLSEESDRRGKEVVVTGLGEGAGGFGCSVRRKGGKAR